jgi:maleate isomerase
MAPGGVGIHASRVPFGAMASGGAMDPTIPLAPVREFADRPELDAAAELLAAAPIDAIAFGFTSSAYVIGREGERAMLSRLAERTRGIPVVATCEATIDALHTLGANRIALVLPPWFDLELSDLGRRFYESAAFDVLSAAPCPLPSDQSRITPAALHEQVAAWVPDDAEAIVIGGNGFRAVGAIEALERDLGRPVLTANQALFWAALQAAPKPAPLVSGYGRLWEEGSGVRDPR